MRIVKTMTIMQKWNRIRETIRESRAFDNPMVEPQVAIATRCVVAALLTIAEVIQERD